MPFFTSCYSFPLQEKENSNKDKVIFYYFFKATLDVDTVQSLGHKWQCLTSRDTNHTVTEISLEYLGFAILLPFASGKTFTRW